MGIMSSTLIRPAFLLLLVPFSLGAVALSSCGDVGSLTPPPSGSSASSVKGMMAFKGPGFGFTYPDDFRPSSGPVGARAKPDFYVEKSYNGGKASLTVSHFLAPGGLDAQQERWATEGMSPGYNVSNTNLGGRPALLRQGNLLGTNLRETTAVMGDQLVQVVVVVPDGISNLNKNDFARMDAVLKSFTFDPIATN